MTRTLITGAGGLVGRALVRHLQQAGEDIIALQSRAECDLTVPDAVNALFRDVRPDKVFHLAASVFGVGGNLKFPGEVFFRNSVMNTFVIEACRLVGVSKIVAMGSAAIYSDGLEQPMREADAMTGEPHGSEYAYAFSKRAMLVQLDAYKQQYGLDFAFVIATNMYGPGDKFDPAHGHVVPSLLKKFLDAEKSGEDVEIWGDGSPTRDFLYSADAADGLARIMASGDGRFNLASGVSIPVHTLVEEVARNFPGVRYYWNTDKPLGQLKRSYDVSRLRKLGFVPQYGLAEGIAETADWLRVNSGDIRQ